jgi:hypothetical protein
MLRCLCMLLSLTTLIAWYGSALAQSAPTACPEPLENRAPRERGQLEKTLADVPVKLGVAEALHDLPAAKPYRPLTDRECECRAAAEATLANLFANELQSVGGRHAKLFGDRLRRLQITILTHSEAEARNQSAGAALELFYRLAEAEARWELLRESITALDSAVAKARELTRQGIMPTGDSEDLLRQRIDLQADALQLHQGIERLNAELKVLLGITGCDSDEWRIWPALELPEEIAAVDPAAALAQGLANRPALALVRLLPDVLTLDTLPAARMLLTSYNALLGGDNPAKRLKVCALVELLAKAICGRAELEKYRTQLQLLALEREQAVLKEIRLAAQAVNLAREHVALAREVVRVRKDRLIDVDAKAAKGIASFKDTTTARTDWLKARGDLAKAAAELLTARAKLREAQGLLGQECCETP